MHCELQIGFNTEDLTAYYITVSCDKSHLSTLSDLFKRETGKEFTTTGRVTTVFVTGY